MKRPKHIWYAVFRRHADRIIAGQKLAVAPDFQVLVAFERFTPQVAELPKGNKVCIDLLLTLGSSFFESNSNHPPKKSAT